MESPSLEIFKSHLDKVLCSLLWVTLLRQGVGLGDPQRSLPTPTRVGRDHCGSSSPPSCVVLPGAACWHSPTPPGPLALDHQPCNPSQNNETQASLAPFVAPRARSSIQTQLLTQKSGLETKVEAGRLCMGSLAFMVRCQVKPVQEG